jgi:hypothetical protein
VTELPSGAATRRAVAALLAAVLLLVGSCGGSPQKDIAMSAGMGVSAAQTVHLALQALDDDDMTSTVAEVAVQDAIGELSRARSQLEVVTPTTARDADLLAEVGAALDRATIAVKMTQQALDGFTGAPSRREAEAAVAAAIKQLEAAEKDAGKPR